MTREDFVIAGKVPLVWDRYYSTSLSESTSPLGRGWTSRYFTTLTRTADGLTFVSPEGSSTTFRDLAAVDAGDVVRDEGAFEEVRRSGGTYVVTRWDTSTGAVERYVYRADVEGVAWPLAGFESVTGQAIDLAYDGRGRLATLRQRLEGRTVRLTYTAADQVERVVLHLPEGPRTLAWYEYDELGRLIRAHTAEDWSDRYEYDAGNRITRETSRDGARFEFQYDDRGRCVRTAGANGYDQKSFRFHDVIQWTEVTDSTGSVGRFQWNTAGQVTCEMNAFGATWRQAFDEFGRIVSRTDPMGRTIQYAYDEDGNLSRAVDPLGHTMAFAYNDAHLPVVLVDQNGQTWTRKYDSANRLIETSDPEGHCSRFEYDAFGNLVASTRPSGATERRTYDRGVLVKTIDSRGGETRFNVDEFGRIIERVDALGRRRRVHFDERGYRSGIEFEDGTSVSLWHDRAGNLSRIVDPLGRETTFRYGTCGRLLERMDAQNRTVRFKWGSEPRRLESITNENGEVHSFAYDAGGRLVRETSFDGRETTYEYDLADNLSAVTGLLAHRIAFERGWDGRLLRRSAPDGTTHAFEYDARGQLVKAETPTSTVLFERDSTGRVIRESQGGRTIETAYDPDGCVRRHSSTNWSAEYAVDSRGRLTGVALGDRRQVSIERDALGMETRRRFETTVEFVHAHDTLGRLIQQIVQASPTAAPSGPIIARNYAYDDNDALVQLDDARAGQSVYVYNDSEELVDLRRTRRRERFEYDMSGNIVASARDSGDADTCVYAAGNRLVRKGETTFAYDDDGRLIERRGPGASDAKTWKYSWSALGELAAVSTPTGELWRYEYDALGRRIAKDGPPGRTEYLWNRDVVVAEFRDGEIQSKWVYEPGTFTPLLTAQQDTVLAVVADQLGTVRELLDATGTVQWAADYSAWGEVDLVVSSATCPFRRSGQWHDPETGLYYSRFRYYDPQIGRFISPDPLGLLGGLNVYAFAPNPINWVDPFGLTHTCDAKAKTHILDGDATGGGHGPGRGVSGKSEFPGHWSDADVINHIESVANDPASRATPQGSRTVIEGTRDGIDIKVVVEGPRGGGGRIVTGYPTNVPRNP
jgi:RHS repeat-associated protein